MFCSHCSAEVLSTSAKFCHSCGKELGAQSGSNTLKPASRQAALSFEDFRKRKGDERCSKFNTKASNSKAAKQPKVEDSEVTIQVGVMVWREDSCSLSAKRGCNLPLKIHTSANADVLKSRAVSKQNRFNSCMVKSSNPIGYKLLYPDKTEVESNFAWQNTEFSLRRYKEELGKPYSRINFYVCSSVDYLSYIGDSGMTSDSDDGNGIDCQISKKSSTVTACATTTRETVNMKVLH